MTRRVKILGLTIKTAMGIIVSLVLATSATSQSAVLSEDAKVKARWVSQTIISENLVSESLSSASEINFTGLPTSEKIRKILQYTHGAVTLSNSLNSDELIEIYSGIVLEKGNQREKTIYQLYHDYLTTINTNDLQQGITPTFIVNFEKATQNQDWFVANRAWILLSNISSRAGNNNLALEQAQNAFKVIPNEISPYVTDARILTLDHTTYLHNLLLNPEMAIETTVELIKQKQKANQSIDGLSLLNNLIFSLSTWREYEISTHLARDALELEKKFDANLPGLTEFRIGRLLNNQGKFLEALPFIESGLSFAENPVVRKNLSIAHVITLAGLGETELAQAEFTALERAFLSTNGNKNDINFNSARAAIAISKGDRDEALRLTASVNDATVQKLLTKYNSNTSDLLANLENAKDRQAEREAALEREASLQKSRAEQKARTNQLLLILSGFLALSALLAVIFARYRDKISKELAIKTLEAEDADRMKSEFLGMISHELRTPLNGIVGIADLLAMQAPSPDLRHKAGIILDSSNKLTHVIESIVDMSRIDGEKMELYPEPTNIHAIVSELEQLWRPAIEDKGVTFTSFVEDSLSEDIIIDKQRLRQCLNSLISNAAKFTDSGRVHLHVTAKLFEAKGETEVTAIIADTGQGMSQTVQEKLFTPFLQADSTMTRKHGGSGLGLAITQSLARMMGGDVTMVSNQGRGSEFTMTVRGEKSDAAIRMDEVEDLLSEVPLAEIEFEKSQDSLRVNAQADLGASSQNASSQDVSHQDITQDGPLILDKTDYAPIDLASHDLEPDAATPINTVKTMDIEINAPIKRAQPTIRRDTDNLRGLKVLIVEDIAANQDIIKLFLGPEGCESLCASDGQEALDVLNTQVVDVILMDIRMPTMDGIEATRAIRGSNREYKNTPIIALTADVSAETNAACMAAGADIFLTKPIMARQLIESIRFVRRFQDTGEDTDKDTGEDATVNAA